MIERADNSMHTYCSWAAHVEYLSKRGWYTGFRTKEYKGKANGEIVNIN